MKILHVTPYYFPAVRYGGPITSIHGLCKALVNKGHEVTVYTTCIDGNNNLDVELDTEVNVEGVKVYYFSSVYFRRLFYSSKMRMALECNLPNFDVLHIHTLFVWPTLISSHYARKYSVPYLLSPRGMYEKDLVKRKSYFIKTLWINIFGRKVPVCAKKIHVTTDREKKELSKFNIKFPEIVVVPNGIDSHIELCVPKKNKSLIIKDFVLYLGRISWEKGLDRLIKSLKYNVVLPLVIAGPDSDNYKEELMKIAETEGVSDRLHFIGAVYGEEKFNLLKKAKLLALCSYSENFGNVLLEAMSVSCPVVVTRDVGLSSVIEKNNAGKVVNGDPEEISVAINSLLSDSKTREEYGLNGKLLVENNYQWDSISTSIETIYQDILN